MILSMSWLKCAEEPSTNLPNVFFQMSFSPLGLEKYNSLDIIGASKKNWQLTHYSGNSDAEPSPSEAQKKPTSTSYETWDRRPVECDDEQRSVKETSQCCPSKLPARPEDDDMWRQLFTTPTHQWHYNVRLRHPPRNHSTLTSLLLQSHSRDLSKNTLIGQNMQWRQFFPF